MNSDENRCLVARDLAKAYGSGANRRTIFSGLDFSLDYCQTAAIFGASGSGKTTLLHVLGGLLPADAGEILCAGVPVNLLVRRCIGFVFQDSLLIPEMTVLENVLLVQKISGQRCDSTWAQDLLDMVGLHGRRRALPRELSGGEKQRASIARAMAIRPRLILADEPTGNLDWDTANQVYGLLFALVRNEGLGLIIATHDESLRSWVDRTYRLEEGKLISPSL